MRPTHKPLLGGPKAGLMAFASAFLLGAVGFTYLLAMFSPAYAQAVAPVVTHGTTVDLTSVANNAANLLYVVLSGAASFVSWAVVSWFGSATKMKDAQFEALLQQRADDILQKAIDAAHTWMLEQIAAKSSQIRTMQFDNFFMAKAVQFAEAAMPDIVAYFKLSPAKIEDMIRARLAPYIGWVEPDSGTVPLAVVPPSAAVPVDPMPAV